KFPDESPVNGRPVRFDPCAPGASARTMTCALGSPKPGTGFPQYSHSRYARRFSRAIFSRYSTSRGQRVQATTSSFRTVSQVIGEAYQCNRSILQHADALLCSPLQVLLYWHRGTIRETLLERAANHCKANLRSKRCIPEMPGLV